MGVDEEGIGEIGEKGRLLVEELSKEEGVGGEVMRGVVEDDVGGEDDGGNRGDRGEEEVGEIV